MTKAKMMMEDKDNMDTSYADALKFLKEQKQTGPLELQWSDTEIETIIKVDTKAREGNRMMQMQIWAATFIKIGFFRSLFGLGRTPRVEMTFTDVSRLMDACYKEGALDAYMVLKTRNEVRA